MLGISTERVVPRYDPRGLWPLAVLAGALWGEVFRHSEWWLEHVGRALGTGAGRIALITVIMIHLALLPFVLLASLHSRVTQARRHFVWGAVWFAAAWMVYSTFAEWLDTPGGGIQSQAQPHIMIVVAVAVVTGIGIAIALSVRWLTRRFFFTLIEQTEPERFCWLCAYEFGDPRPEVCHECGKPLAGQRVRMGWYLRSSDRLHRAGKPLLVLACLAAAVITGWIITTRTIPAWQFVKRFDEGCKSTYAYIDKLPGVNPLGGRFINSVGRTIPLNDGTDRMLLVSFHGSPPHGLPVMQVRICGPATLPPGWPADAEFLYTDWGSPQIVADLNRDQAERVIRDGLPERLRQAIVDRAAAVGWKTVGGIQGGMGTREVIDPAPFFPAAK